MILLVRESRLSFDGGRGIGVSQNSGLIYVATPGYYGMRVLFYNGGGGSGWRFILPARPKRCHDVLVNDTNEPVSCGLPGAGCWPYSASPILNG